MTFTSSTKAGPSDDTNSSDDQTSSPIAARLSSPKTKPATNRSKVQARKAPVTPKKELPPRKRNRRLTIDHHNIASKSSQKSRNDSSTSPSPKRHRSSRTSAQTPVIYSTRWHPMDDVVRPKRAAKLKAAYGTSPGQWDTDSSDEKQEGGSCETQPDSNDDEQPSEHPDHASSPNRRRSPRTLPSKNVPNYDMK